MVAQKKYMAAVHLFSPSAWGPSTQALVLSANSCIGSDCCMRVPVYRFLLHECFLELGERENVKELRLRANASVGGVKV